MKFFLKRIAANTLFLVLFFTNTANAQIIALPNDCKFKIGDEITWANPSLNDSNWSNIKLGASCLSPEMKKDVFVWMRIKFIIPQV
ncbi:MAG: hypothetical protein IPP48_16980 [Chitinophagaceae bacterium]|nr:hypothetical protein [Chitinophagaceae bacterium]